MASGVACIVYHCPEFFCHLVPRRALHCVDGVARKLKGISRMGGMCGEKWAYRSRNDVLSDLLGRHEPWWDEDDSEGDIGLKWMIKGPPKKK